MDTHEKSITGSSECTTASPADMITISKEEYDALKIIEEESHDQQSFWSDALKNPDGVIAFKNAITEILQIWGTVNALSQKAKLVYSVVRIGIVVILLTIIILTASQLVQMGKLDGGSLIFLLGTIVGYLLTFLSKIEGLN
jgi:hypothetical protein